MGSACAWRMVLDQYVTTHIYITVIIQWKLIKEISHYYDKCGP